MRRKAAEAQAVKRRASAKGRGVADCRMFQVDMYRKEGPARPAEAARRKRSEEEDRKDIKVSAMRWAQTCDPWP